MTQTRDSSGDDAEKRLSTLRHDLRNDLATALLAADLLTNHADESVQRHATSIVNALEKATERLKRSRKPVS
ncbi:MULTISPECIES: hypothetical protein [Asaia]|uniref:hypothetical protein n=1 Tax=Asaia TaxID=91914 RepID=UPI002FC2ABB0